MDSLKKSFSKIEKIILKDPNEALEMPLLKRDLEESKVFNEARIESLNKDIERAYNIILVSLTGLAVSVFAPVLSSLWRTRK